MNTAKTAALEQQLYTSAKQVCTLCSLQSKRKTDPTNLNSRGFKSQRYKCREHPVYQMYSLHE